MGVKLVKMLRERLAIPKMLCGRVRGTQDGQSPVAALEAE